MALLFNANINLRVPEIHTIKPIYILFCYEGSVMSGEAFKPNHFASLLFNTSSQNSSFKMFLNEKNIMHSPRQMEELLDISGWICLKWLYNSPSANGAFCLSCVLFGDRLPGRAGKIPKFQNFQPLLHWNNAVFIFKKHAGHRVACFYFSHSSSITFSNFWGSPAN